jgi:hypothetical protein
MTLATAIETLEKAAEAELDCDDADGEGAEVVESEVAGAVVDEPELAAVVEAAHASRASCTDCLKLAPLTVHSGSRPAMFEMACMQSVSAQTALKSLVSKSGQELTSEELRMARSSCVHSTALTKAEPDVAIASEKSRTEIFMVMSTVGWGCGECLEGGKVKSEGTEAINSCSVRPARRALVALVPSQRWLLLIEAQTQNASPRHVDVLKTQRSNHEATALHNAEPFGSTDCGKLNSALEQKSLRSFCWISKLRNSVTSGTFWMQPSTGNP